MTISDSAHLLAQLMAKRRTRRFACGATLPKAGPLAFESTTKKPLEPAHEAALAFAAVGMTGSVLAELPFQEGEEGGGNIMANLLGRTVVSPDAAHPTGVFVINDHATYYLKRPQDLDQDEVTKLLVLLTQLISSSSAEAASESLNEMYIRLRVELDRGKGSPRPVVPESPPHTPIFNRWASNKPGTTLFLPVMELTEQYLCALFGGLDEAAGYYLLDDRNGLQPSGLRMHAKSVGGYLRDNDPKRERVFVQDFLDTVVPMFASVELGAIMQNMSLMANALGIGGWPHWAAGHKWLEALGFAHKDIKVSKLLGLPAELAIAMRATGDDEEVWSPLGLRGHLVDGKIRIRQSWDGHASQEETWLIRPYCPPNYSDMTEAINAFVDAKYGNAGRFRKNGQPSGWKDEDKVKERIPRYTQRQIEAAIDHAEYLYDRYGRFPVKFGPLVTLTAFQAHQFDRDFYEKYYKQE